MTTDKVVDIRSRDYRFRIVKSLQQNWALIHEDERSAVFTLARSLP